MARVEILPVPDAAGVIVYAAVSGEKESRGRTPGEALDALMSQLSGDSAILVIVQDMAPDRYFNAEQQRRLRELMARWREARDAGRDLPAPEQSELDALIESEVRASGRRTAALLDDLA
jgi:hypothetical protein